MTRNETPQERIRALMDEDPLDPTETEVGNADADALDTALADAGLDVLSAEAQNIVLALTSSVAGLEPGTRDRFVKAAGRGLQNRRDSLSPLPRLLFLARKTTTESIELVATSVSVDADMLLKAERGKVELEALGAQAVATWINHFGVPIEQAKEALAKALALESNSDRAAASAAGCEAAKASEFFSSVINHLQQQTGT